MNEFDELMDVENEVEEYEGGKDLSGYIGAGAIAVAGALMYEGGKQLGKRVVKPGFNWLKDKIGKHRAEKDSAAEEATVEAETTEEK